MRRDINFFSVYHTQSDSEGIDRFKMIVLSLTVGSFIIVLGIFAALKVADFLTVRQMQTDNSYLLTPGVSQAQKNLSDGSYKLAVLDGYKQEAEKVTSGFNTLPKVDSTILSKIASMLPADITVTGISYSVGTLVLNCTCTDNQSPAVFVHTLQQSGKFDDVNYTGFSQGTAKSYTFDVTITVKEGGGK